MDVYEDSLKKTTNYVEYMKYNLTHLSKDEIMKLDRVLSEIHELFMKTVYDNYDE
jgi:hypothetical protein